MKIVLNGTQMIGRPTGVGQYGLGLLRSLCKLQTQGEIEALGVFDGFRVVGVDEFFSTAPRQASSWRQKVVGLVRRCVPQARTLRDGWMQLRLKRDIAQSGWHLYHETNYVAPELSTPLVTTVHDMSFLRTPQFVPKHRAQWLRAGLNKTMRQAAAILVDSEFTRREILDFYPHTPTDKIHTALLGVDFERFADPTNAAKAAELRERLKLPEQFALFLGTLEPRKNLQGLIAAYARLPADLQCEFPLVLAGTAGWRQHYFRPQLNVLRDRGVLHETGYVPQADVPALLAAAAVFCFPSLYEGFGLAPLEAAAAGVPVLSSNAASLPEVLGDAAVYVDPHDVESIAAGLREIFENAELRRTLGVAGQLQARRFTWDQCARRTLEAYRRAA